MRLLVFESEGLIVVVKLEFADIELVVLGLVFIERASDGGVDACKQLVHTERLGDVVVGAHLEAFELVGLERLGCEEENRDILVDASQLFGHSEAVFDRHHHVEDAGVDITFLVDVEGLLSVCGVENSVPLLRQIDFEYHCHIGVVFSY